MLSSEGIVELNEIFSSPLKKLDFLYEIVKEQVGDRDEYEEDLDIVDAFESLEVDVANFFQTVDTSNRWSSLQLHNKKISTKQLALMESVMEDPKVEKMLEKMKDDALEALSTQLNGSQES